MPDTDPFAKTGEWQDGDSERIADESAYSPPAHIGRYRIDRELGSGGFGRVYLATDEQLGRQVAVKIPHQYLIESLDNAADYLLEAKTVAGLDHANIVPVHDVGSTDRFPCFVVSKYVEGLDLAEVMKSNPPDFREAAAIIATLADALHYAHNQGVVHRDIKPSNILLTASRTPYLVDFGLALREGDPRAGTRYVGTPAYSSPEQARGEGHRIDGRSDIFSLGVVLYELLAGRKPFDAKSTADLLTSVIADDPKPLRQVSGKIPKELERICFRALCKRASDRYMTGRDLADDLRAFLQSTARATDVESAAAAEPTTNSEKHRVDFNSTVRPELEVPLSEVATAPRIVPKGLRSFDINDSEFFLELLPGPRDRDGAPDSIRFWLTRIQSPQVADNCAVGLIYGPSGCGKSSLIKAGILPRLDADVVPVYVEATRRDTERTLLRSLRHACPEVPPDADLAASLAAIRRDARLGPNRKVLLIIDQFEQWLHEHEGQSESELMKALRQCDGRHVQTILLVRDDFWMAITQFMSELDIPLVESQNTMAVGLFDMRHAAKVLESFGRAYGALPDAPAELTADQKKFVSNAVNGLAKDGRVVCLDIALFADMLRDKTWRTDTWRAFGGTRGVGVQFLEDAFSAERAPADSRVHSEAAQAVLKRLLPDAGNDIKGYSRTEAELFAASGYQHQSDFHRLLALLDHKLRLITPVAQTVIHRTTADDSQSSGPQETLYQLTHDFLVHAVQEWLKRRQEETRRGRAQRRLTELTSMYSVSPNVKLLPATLDYLRLRTWTDRRHWTDAERRLMQAAGKSVARRWTLASLGCAILLAGVFAIRMAAVRQAKEQRLDDLVARLLDADLSEVENVVREVRSYGEPARQRLLKVAEDPGRLDRERLRTHLGLIDRHAPSSSYVTSVALRSSPEELAILCGFLAQAESVAKDLRGGIDSDTPLQRHVRAAAILAQVQSGDGLSEGAAGRVATALMEQDQVTLIKWASLLVPLADSLQGPLESYFANRDGSSDSQNAAIALAVLRADAPSRLTSLALSAEPRQFVALFPALVASPDAMAAGFRESLEAEPASVWQVSNLASQQHELPRELRDTIQKSHGMVNDGFMMIQQFPWSDFPALARPLAEFGYRPAVVRPYGDSHLQVAAIWTRDGVDWELVGDVSAAEIVAAHDRNHDRGWIARDVSRYATTDADGTKRMVFAALWSPRADGENVVEGEMYVAVPETEHQSAWQPLNARGFLPRANFKFHNDSGEPCYTSVRWRLRRAFEYRDWWDSDSLQSAKPPDSWNWQPTDIRIYDDGSSSEPRIAATWWQDSAQTAQLVRSDDLRQHRDRCEELALQGYRPLAISVYQGAEAARRQAATVWYRPLRDSEEQNASVARKANALIGLWRLERYAEVLPWLSAQSDRPVRSEFIHRGTKMGVSAASLYEAFEMSGTDDVARQALLAGLSQLRPDRLETSFRHSFVRLLLGQYRTNPDAGLHSHIELLLRRWEVEPEESEQIAGDLAAYTTTEADARSKGWFVTAGGMTMSIIPGPADFLMGSPLNERGRDAQKETRHLRRVDRTYALSTREVTVAEFLRYRPAFDYPQDYSPLPDCPIEHLDWYDAVRYCRWLSERENIPEDEMCYPPLDQIGEGMRIPEGFLGRIGYRLPTEAEWEYACRANSETSRHYGDQPLLLGDYAWTAENSNYRSKPVAQLLPNDFGLFDMLGNVMEWCHDNYDEYPTPSLEVRYDDEQRAAVIGKGDSRVTRGGGFLYQPLDARSAQRYGHFVTSRRPYLGFRVARTIRPVRQESAD